MRDNLDMCEYFRFLNILIMQPRAVSSEYLSPSKECFECINTHSNSLQRDKNTFKGHLANFNFSVKLWDSNQLFFLLRKSHEQVVAFYFTFFILRFSNCHLHTVSSFLRLKSILPTLFALSKSWILYWLHRNEIFPFFIRQFCISFLRQIVVCIFFFRLIKAFVLHSWRKRWKGNLSTCCIGCQQQLSTPIKFSPPPWGSFTYSQTNKVHTLLN